MRKRQAILGKEVRSLVDTEFVVEIMANDPWIDVFAVAHGAIFAGSDSTASTMQSFCYHVLRDPVIYSRLETELDEATAASKLSPMPQWNEVQALPYFQACLKEAMRLRPAVGLNITRFVPPEGVELDGRKIPGGTRVAVNAWVLHRDESIFGRDPKVFRPDRWLEGDAKNMERYMFQVRLISLLPRIYIRNH
jgi:cytochrome P450